MKFKKVNYFLLFSLLASIVSCSHDPIQPEPPGASITVAFSNSIDGNLIQRGPMIYTNDAGNLYSVEMLKYYISNFTFIKTDGTEYKAPENYELIDDSIYSSRFFTITGVPHGVYTKVRFNVGVDSTKNFAGPQNGDLDPINGMLWDWITGYLFFKHEGHFIDSTGATDIVRYHYGSLKGLVTIEIPMTFGVNAGVNHRMTIDFNLNKVYRSPNLIDFNGNNFHQSTGPNDQVWLQLIKENFQGAFAVVYAQ